MPQPTVNDVQAIDPVLTNMLVGYMQNDSRFVAGRVFPYVPTEKDSGTYYVFDKKYWFTDELAPRAPGGPFARIGFGVSTATFLTAQFAGAYALADEIRRNSQIPMDLEQAAIRLLAQKSLIRKEVAFSADFMKTGVWATDDNNSAADWDDFSAGDPVDNVLTAKRTISNSTGMDGNTMVLGYIVHQALVNHPDVIDRIAYTQQANQGNIENALAAIFGVANYWVAKSSYNSANEAQTASMAAIIDDDCLVAYVTPSPSIFEASAGYTFGWDGGGGNGQISPIFRDGEHDSDLIKHKEQWDQKAVATDCGYFFSDIV
jgi:hypothetical protein